MKTTKLYEISSFMKECETIITGTKEEEGRYYVTLERSIFFPEGGGQYADTGMITYQDGEEEIQIRVLDGQIMDDEPWYLISEKISSGTKVHCQLDWEKRFDRMQQHSGEHIIMGVIHNRFGYENKGFHISDDAPTTLVLSGVLSKKEIEEIELEANRMIYQNLSMIDSYPTDEELANITYRSKIEIEGQVRLITIKNDEMQLDCCACCAPHVKMTGQVGLIKVVSVSKQRGGTSLLIVCGERAFTYVREQMGYITEIANKLSTSTDKVSRIMDNQKEEITRLNNKVGELTEAALLKQIEEQGDKEHACIFTQENLSTVSMKNVYNHMTSVYPGFSAIFMGNDETGYRYSAGSHNLDSRELAKKMREALDAKGGGKPDMIQGKVAATREEIERFFTEGL